jgi:hypothetical protein
MTSFATSTSPPLVSSEINANCFFQLKLTARLSRTQRAKLRLLSETTTPETSIQQGTADSLPLPPAISTLKTVA